MFPFLNRTLKALICQTVEKAAADQNTRRDSIPEEEDVVNPTSGN